MARNPSTPIKTPGVQSTEPPQDDGRGETDMDALAKGAADLDDGAGDAPRAVAGAEAAPTVTLTVVQLQAMIAAEVSKAVGASLPTGTPRPEPDLPDQSDIDPKKITRPTLSKQGYVVPENYGEPAANGVKRA
jgi:hypothetical protein